MVISLLVYIFFSKYLPNKEKKVTEDVEKVNFKPIPLFAAILAMGITAFGLHFIQQVGWANGFAFGLLAGFITWIVMSANKDEMARITALITCIHCCDFLLDVISSEWTHPYSLCQRLYCETGWAIYQYFLHFTFNACICWRNSRTCYACLWRS